MTKLAFCEGHDENVRIETEASHSKWRYKTEWTKLVVFD